MEVAEVAVMVMVSAWMARMVTGNKNREEGCKELETDNHVLGLRCGATGRRANET